MIHRIHSLLWEKPGIRFDLIYILGITIFFVTKIIIDELIAVYLFFHLLFLIFQMIGAFYKRIPLHIRLNAQKSTHINQYLGIAFIVTIVAPTYCITTIAILSKYFESLIINSVITSILVGPVVIMLLRTMFVPTGGSMSFPIKQEIYADLLLVLSAIFFTMIYLDTFFKKFYTWVHNNGISLLEKIDMLLNFDTLFATLSIFMILYLSPRILILLEDIKDPFMWIRMLLIFCIIYLSQLI